MSLLTCVCVGASLLQPVSVSPYRPLCSFFCKCIVDAQFWKPGSPWSTLWRFCLRVYISTTSDVKYVADTYLKVFCDPVHSSMSYELIKLSFYYLLFTLYLYIVGSGS